jgi:hypothetical protein
MRFFPQGEQRDGGAADMTRLPTDLPLYPEAAFHNVIDRELTRTSRSGRSFLLMLVDISGCPSPEMARKVASVLSSSTREIDAKGWYAEGATLGILCTEFGSMNNIHAAGEVIVSRLYGRLSDFFEDDTPQIVPYTMAAGLTGREDLPQPWMHDGRRKHSAT